MSDHHSHPPVDPNLLEEMGYERTDVDVAKLSKSTIAFFVVSTIIMFAGVATMWVMAPRMTFGAPEERMQERVRKPGPEQPLVQSNATAQADMHEFLQREQEVISSYGWSDRKSGHVRIPIDEAMKRVVAKGLPSNPSPAGLEVSR